MSDETVPQTPGDATTDSAPPPAGPSRAILYGVVGAALLVGGALGAMVIAPSIRPPDTIIVQEAPKPADHDSGEVSEKEAPGGEGRLVRLDNLIVNPAGSQGTRFLMVSVAVEAPNAKVEEALRARDAQIRDVVIALLERKTMDALSQPGARDVLKKEMADTLGRLSGARLRVYLPQFVIQ